MNLDTSWTLTARSTTSTSYTARWTGSGKSIPAHGYFLIANSTGYTGTPTADQTLSSGITDSSSVRLLHSSVPVDAVCYYATGDSATDYDSSYTCEGTPVSNAPHTNSSGAASDVNVRLERKDCTDTDDNASDFISLTPGAPRSTTSPLSP